MKDTKDFMPTSLNENWTSKFLCDFQNPSQFTCFDIRVMGAREISRLDEWTDKHLYQGSQTS